jgi:hypothetical protein
VKLGSSRLTTRRTISASLRQLRAVRARHEVTLSDDSSEHNLGVDRAAGGNVAPRRYPHRRAAEDARVPAPQSARRARGNPHAGAPLVASMNRYAYVFNDPINATDPSGFLSMSDVVKGFVYVGQFASARLFRIEVGALAENKELLCQLPGIATCDEAGVRMYLLISDAPVGRAPAAVQTASWWTWSRTGCLVLNPRPQRGRADSIESGSRQNHRVADGTGHGGANRGHGQEPNGRTSGGYAGTGLEPCDGGALASAYQKAIETGGKKLQNEQLLPRAQLMDRILELWPKVATIAARVREHWLSHGLLVSPQIGRDSGAEAHAA